MCDANGWDPTTVPGANGNPPYYHDAPFINVKQYTGNGQLTSLVMPVASTTAPGTPGDAPAMTFAGNSASVKGGAVYVGTQNSFVFFMRGVVFRGNAATGTAGAGGALAFDTQNEYVYLYSTVFATNGATAQVINKTRGLLGMP